MKKNIDLNQDVIFVIAQHFYGNRTGTKIRRENINSFLKGILDRAPSTGETETVDRKVVKIPGADNVVIVYDQNQEDEYINVKFPERAKFHKEKYGEDIEMRTSCEIPEIGFKIHTRCFACRVDEAGQLQSLQREDGEIVMKYLAE